MIRAGSGLSRETEPGRAGAEAAREAVDGLEKPRLAFVFASGLDASALGRALEGAKEKLLGAVPVGCSGGGVVGWTEEVEGEPAVTVLAVEAGDDVALEPFLVPLTGEGVRDARGLAARLAGKAKGPLDRSALVLFPDPFAFDARPFLARLRDDMGKIPVTGGLAASAKAEGEVPVFAGSERKGHAASGALLSGPGVRAMFAVAQGCRELGISGQVTRSHENLIFEVAGEPAVEKLKLALEAARPTGASVFCGLGLDAFAARGAATESWLARNVLGVDRKTGAVAVAEVVPQGSWVSFLARDADAARADLGARARELKAALGGKAPAFGLYFDCVGRGRGLYGEPDVDVSIIEEELGAFPLAGFFGNGELAPFLGRNLVHNYTGVLLLVGSG